MKIGIFGGLRLVLLTSLALTALIWALHSKHEERFDPLRVQDPSATPHFVAEMESHLSAKGLSEMMIHTTIYFQSPDDWRIVERKGEEAKEQVVIGNQAWERSSGSWRAVDAKLIRGTTLSIATRLASLGGTGEDFRLVRGPRIGDEPTIRALIRRPDIGGTMNEAFDAAVADDPVSEESIEAIHDIYRDSALTIRLYIGRETNRLHLAVVEWVGPNLKIHQTMHFDYTTTVTIEAPR